MSMRILVLAALFTGLVACERASQESPQPADRARAPGPEQELGFDYPQPRDGGAADDYFGTLVADPYRWMEDYDSAEVKAWVEAQNAVAMPYLRGLPGYERIKERLTELWNYERFQIPYKAGGRYFFEHNDGLQDQYVLYVKDGLQAERRVLIDPNGFTADRTSSLASYVPSPDGSKLAYSVSEGGSDWDSWRIRDVGTGEDYEDHIRFTKFTSVSWTPDSTGFYYSRYPEGEDGEGDDSKQVRVYFHTLGTSQDQDELVYEITDHATRNPYAQITEDGHYLVIGVFDGYESNGIYYRDLRASDGEVVRLLDDWDALYTFKGNIGSTFIFETNLEAPLGRIMTIDVEDPDRSRWREIVPESEDTLRDSEFVGGHIIGEYLNDVVARVRVYDLNGALQREVELPGTGSIPRQESGRRSSFAGDQDDPETFFAFTGFTTPTTIYRYDVESGETAVFGEPGVKADLSSYETRQVFYASTDGTRIPMFIVAPEGTVLDGDNPLLLYGYGGFNISLMPGYSPARIVWLEMGGLLAIPNLRGGGEYGEEWHLAGTKLEKQNVFDDFIAAAEYLIDEGWTSMSRLAIQGRSNGGLLVGAVMTQRPDLFGVALPAVGVLDMLRYHTASANARQWSSDYGLSENEQEFRALYDYSPYHNVQDGTCYPPTLVTTADHDDRVVPWHSFKFGAALQVAQGCDNPVIVRVETRAGHGAGKPTWMRIEDIAEHWAFTAHHLGLEMN